MQVERARRAQTVAALAWDEVSDLEKTIAEHPETPTTERDIAERGHARAYYTAQTIRMAPSRLPREIEEREP